MATAEQTFPVARPRYTGILEWITTVDHKKIGVLYLFTTFFFFLSGGLLALAIRTQLATPDGTVLTAQQYNAAFTMHGTTMVFLFVVPVWTGFANFIIPLQLGARDMAFPRLNALSYWLLLSGGIILYSSFLVGPPASGWTSYVPLSTKPFSPGFGQDLWIIGLTVLGFSSIFGALNMIVTIFSLRAPGMTFHRITLFAWSVLVTSFLLVLAMPFLTVAGVLLLFDRIAGTNFFGVGEGADPLLWQYLFWFFGHPEVYIMILPGFGVISEVLPVFSRKPIFGYKMIAYASVAIGFLSFGVFVHHMFVAGIDPALQIFFMSSTMLIAVPTGVKVFSWLGTIWGGSLRFKTPMLFSLGFLAVFTIGGISGVFLGSVPGRHPAVGHVLRRRAYPLRARRRRALLVLRRGLLLDTEDHRTADERTARHDPVPDLLPRLQPRVLPDAPARPRGHAAPHLSLRPVARVGFPEPRRNDRCLPHRALDPDLHLQLHQQHRDEGREDRRRRPVGGRHPRVGDELTTTGLTTSRASRSCTAHAP
jgi:hypothetical protein